MATPKAARTFASEADLNRALGRLEGKVDLILARLDAGLIAETRQDDRINTLERGSTRIHSYAALIAFIVSAIVPILITIFKVT